MPLTNEHLSALGRVSVNFTALEFTLVAALVGLLGVDQPIAQAIASQLSFARLLNAIDAIFRHKAGDGPDTERLKAILKRASEAEGKRNVLLHSVYLFAEGAPPDVVTRLKFKTKRDKGLSHETQDLTPRDLNLIADEIGKVGADLASFVAELAQRQTH